MNLYQAREAIEKLKTGYENYAIFEKKQEKISKERRLDLVENGQNPYAVVISCADSRVVPEIIFCAQPGELFTIRAAGNIVGELQLGSIEYAIGLLKCPVVLVLGHTYCGAVRATIQGGAQNFIKTITEEIKGAIGEEQDEQKAVVQNVQHTIFKIKEALKIEKEYQDVEVIGAMYDIETGQLSWLS